MATKEKRLLADEKAMAKTATALDQMLTAVKERKPQHPAKAIIQHNMQAIDELNRRGVALALIYEKVNKAVKLGISSSSFVQYVREIRKENGSDLYRPVGPRKRKTEQSGAAVEAPAATKETANTAADWNCESCKDAAVRRESTKRPGFYYWKCQKCGTNYVDDGGELSNTRA